MLDFYLERFNLAVIGLFNFRQQVFASLLELVMSELPISRLFTDFGVLEPERVALDFSKAVKVELTNEAGKIGMLEKLWNNARSESIRVLDDKGRAIVSPFRARIELEREEKRRKTIIGERR